MLLQYNLRKRILPFIIAHMSGKQKMYLGIVYSSFFALLICLNFLISYLVKTGGLFFVANQFPFNLQVTPISLWVILVFVTYAVFQFRLFQIAPISSTLLLSGAWSNFIERLVFGFVTDYIVLGSLYFNLADVQIWLGILLINLILWGVIKKDTFGQPL